MLFKFGVLGTSSKKREKTWQKDNHQREKAHNEEDAQNDKKYNQNYRSQWSSDGEGVDLTGFQQCRALSGKLNKFWNGTLVRRELTSIWECTCAVELTHITLKTKVSFWRSGVPGGRVLL